MESEESNGKVLDERVWCLSGHEPYKRNEDISSPTAKKANFLSEDVITLVKNFHQNNKFSKILPGKKEKVSVSTNVHVQKKLLLLNLNELHSSFESEYPNIKVGFSKFCMFYS